MCKMHCIWLSIKLARSEFLINNQELLASYNILTNCAGAAAIYKNMPYPLACVSNHSLTHAESDVLTHPILSEDSENTRPSKNHVT